ncbi:hypothetical protein ABTE37_20645, partial [Acinetobacter baumannii]
IYTTVALAPAMLLALIHKKAGLVFAHALNVIAIIMYVSLLIVFSERNVPFDHEFFTRSSKDSWLTTKQMMTSGFKLY